MVRISATFWRCIGWGGAGALLLTPLVAMQYTDEVQWTGSDSLFMGLLFGAIGLGLELAMRRGGAAYRLGAAIALALGFFLVWINAAVGIIGDGEEASMLYVLIPLAAVAVAALGRFRPAGMASAMGVAATGQLMVPLIAWLAWPEVRAAVLAPEVLGLTVIFATGWLVAAALFRRASREQVSPGVGA